MLKGRVVPHFKEEDCRNPRRKLSDKDAAEIRDKHLSRKCSLRKLGEDYHVGRETIRKIIKGETYKDQKTALPM